MMIARVTGLILFLSLPEGRLTAQVALERDPFHKVVLENEYIRLLDGQVPALDTTLLHTHAANSVVVFLSKSKFGIQNAGESPLAAEVKPGEVVYRAYGDSPVKHKVWDESKSLFHFWVVELVRKRAGKDTCSTLSSAGVALTWRKKLVSAYRLTGVDGSSIHLPPSTCAYLLLNISGTTSVELKKRTHALQPDGFFFIPPGSDMKIISGKEGAACVLLELR